MSDIRIYYQKTSVQRYIKFLIIVDILCRLSTNHLQLAPFAMYLRQYLTVTGRRAQNKIVINIKKIKILCAHYAFPYLFNGSTKINYSHFVNE